MATRTQTCLVALIAVKVLVCLTSCSHGGPAVYVGKNVAADQRVSINEIDHRLWDQLLHKFVDQRGRVAYQPWAENTGHVRALDAYLGMLSTADPQKPASRSAKLAYWINAYNAVTVKGILREFLTDSIRNHTSKISRIEDGRRCERHQAARSQPMGR